MIKVKYVHNDFECPYYLILGEKCEATEFTLLWNAPKLLWELSVATSVGGEQWGATIIIEKPIIDEEAIILLGETLEDGLNQSCEVVNGC